MEMSAHIAGAIRHHREKPTIISHVQPGEVPMTLLACAPCMACANTRPGLGVFRRASELVRQLGYACTAHPVRAPLSQQIYALKR